MLKAEPDIQLEDHGNGQFSLGGHLGLDTAKAALHLSDRIFISPQGASVDLSRVVRTDSAGLAVLIEWVKRANRNGVALAFRNVPRELQALAAISEMDSLLPLEATL